MTEQIIELDLGCRPDAAVSGAVLVSSEYSTFLTFNAVQPADDGSDRIVSAGHALVEFALCTITKFGYPNDEARWGIARYQVTSYAIYEVKNSEWIPEIVRLNRYHFPDTPDDTTTRHFLIAFHDSTFECLADDIKIELIREPYERVFERISARLLAE